MAGARHREAPFHLSFDSHQLADGAYELRIKAVGAGGHSTFSRRFGPYVVDNTPPWVVIVAPRGGEAVSGDVEVVVRTADDGSGPKRVVVSCSEGGEWRLLDDLEALQGEVKLTWRPGEHEAGHCDLRATARDRAGNEASHIASVTIVEKAAEQAVVDAPAGIDKERSQSDEAVLLEDRDRSEQRYLGSEMAPPDKLPAR